MSESIYNPDTLKKLYNATLMTSVDAEKIENEYKNQYCDYLNIEDGGFTVYSKTKNIKLSKGCQACKHGKWLCVFVGYNCNLQCAFCPQDKRPEFINSLNQSDLTSHGTIPELEYYLLNDSTIEGVSYSGGEPLLYIDKILKLASFVNSTCKNIYQWIYTNGILLNEEMLIQLKEVGIDEIRLDLAATKFSDEVIDKIKLIKRYIKRVTVEIPALPEIRALMENNLLDKIVEYGVEQLNISEMNLFQEVNMQNYGRDKVVVAHQGIYKGITLFESKVIYYELLDYIVKKQLDILLNNCNSNAKFIQLINKQRNQFVFKT